MLDFGTLGIGLLVLYSIYALFILGMHIHNVYTNKNATNRLIWFLVITFIPLFGGLAYLIFKILKKMF